MVDLVIVDDDKTIVKNMLTYMLNGKEVDVYYTAEEFLAKVAQYPKDTKILIDHQFDREPEITGLELNVRLKDIGFKNCCVFSGMPFSEEEVPAGIQVIMKTDLEAIMELVNR